VKASVKALIHAAKSIADHKPDIPVRKPPVSVCVPPVVVDRLAGETEWSTFPQVATRFCLSWNAVAKQFVGRDGVIKVGSDYRVAEFAVRGWLSQCAQKAKEAA
jgi:hypothetical protein